jgi:hypothetical protein
MGLLQVIKQAGAEAVDAGNPVALMFGTITKTNPLEVNVDQRFLLPADFLIVPEQLTSYEVDLKHSHDYADGVTQEALTEKVVIRRGLEVGDKVLLCRMQGGQKFIVLDRVVEA